MKRLSAVLLSSIVLMGATACREVARTSADAPDSVEETPEVLEADEAQDTQEDAQNSVRQDQLDSDIRAREERNDLTGGDAERADSDLASEVRSKLEANLPASALTIEAEDSAVTITGTVPTQEQFDRIEPLAKEIKGVMMVTNEAIVAPAVPE
ncbi:MAG: BON domain-containing protein [Cyanobacteriota bacterium]|nr:BON domain-containing protein [Cyanobacteriota bacterium]